MRELEIIEAISRGIDPCDGTELKTPRDPELDKARLAYLAKLRRFAKSLSKSTERKPGEPPNHGKAWSEREDRIVRDRWNSPEAPSAEILADLLGRGTGAILARLVHLGVFPDRETARQANAVRNTPG